MGILWLETCMLVLTTVPYDSKVMTLNQSYSYTESMNILWLKTCMIVFATVSYDLKVMR